MNAKVLDTAPVPPASAGAPPVLVQDLRKSYGTVRAVDGLSFEVQPGEVFGLLGPNGAGKTTTVEILVGLRDADGGRAQVCGLDPAARSRDVKQRIGVALQSTALPDKLRVREALVLFAGFYARSADVDELLTTVSLGEKAGHSFDSLSGGQKQRLAVALALVNDPEVVILDEPTAGLDPQARRDLHEVIGRLRQRGRTVILTTHYIEEAERLCDRVAIIDHGRLIALDAPRRIVAQSHSAARIEFRTAAPLDPTALRQVPFADSVAVEGDAYVLRTGNVARAAVALIKWLEAGGHELLDLYIARPTLEDVFIERTGRRIRE